MVSKALVEWLEGQFPNRVPKKDATMRQVFMAVGEQTVITKLRHTMEHQLRNQLEK